MAIENYIKTYFKVEKKYVSKIAEHFHPMQLPRNAYFSRKENYCDQLAFVQSGHIRVFDIIKDKEITQWISSPGQLITDLRSFVFNQRSRWYMQAIDDVQLFVIKSKDFNNLKEIIPNWSKIEKEFIADCFITLENRVHSHLSLSAEERYNHLYTYNPDIFERVPQQYIASMLGMTPETFSRIRKKINS